MKSTIRRIHRCAVFGKRFRVQRGERGTHDIRREPESEKEALDLEARIYGFEQYKLAEHITLRNTALKTVNSAQKEKVKPAVASGGQFDGGKLEARLPAATWSGIRLKRG
ncbi:MAG: hypothetical protein LBL45_10595 [Treponema sp.]|nr:hypothetical protein [Treponema sp.]